MKEKSYYEILFKNSNSDCRDISPCFLLDWNQDWLFQAYCIENWRFAPPHPPNSYYIVDNQYDIPIMQKATERGWENCLRQMGETREVVFYGNSITRNGHWQEWFPEKQVCNLGLGGDDLLGLKRRIGMVTCLAPSKVFVMGGINGIRNTTYESFEIQYSDLCQTLSDSLPKAKVFLQSMLPVDSSRFEDYASNEKIDSCNRIIKNLAEQYGMTFVDLFSSYLELSNTLEIYSDGIHLKEEYYYLWVETITAYLQ